MPPGEWPARAGTWLNSFFDPISPNQRCWMVDGELNHCGFQLASRPIEGILIASSSHHPLGMLRCKLNTIIYTSAKPPHHPPCVVRRAICTSGGAGEAGRRVQLHIKLCPFPLLTPEMFSSCYAAWQTSSYAKISGRLHEASLVISGAVRRQPVG